MHGLMHPHQDCWSTTATSCHATELPRLFAIPRPKVPVSSVKICLRKDEGSMSVLWDVILTVINRSTHVGSLTYHVRRALWEKSPENARESNLVPRLRGPLDPYVNCSALTSTGPSWILASNSSGELLSAFFPRSAPQMLEGSEESHEVEVSPQFMKKITKEYGK